MEILRIIQEHRVIAPNTTGADYLRRACTQIKLAQGSADGSVERQLAVDRSIGNVGLLLECPISRLGNLTQELDAFSEGDPTGFLTFDTIFKYTEAIKKVDKPRYVSALKLAAFPAGQSE